MISGYQLWLCHSLLLPMMVLAMAMLLPESPSLVADA